MLITRSIPFLAAHLTVGKAISYLIALTFSYAANATWTFKQRLAPQKLLLFYATVGSGIFINTGVHYIAISQFGINDIIAVLCAAAGTAVWGFALAKLVVFRA